MHTAWGMFQQKLYMYVRTYIWVYGINLYGYCFLFYWFSRKKHDWLWSNNAERTNRLRLMVLLEIWKFYCIIHHQCCKNKSRRGYFDCNPLLRTRCLYLFLIKFKRLNMVCIRMATVNDLLQMQMTNLWCLPENYQVSLTWWFYDCVSATA